MARRNSWPIGAALACIMATAPAAAEPLSAEALLEPPSLLDIDLSPDGSRIAAIVRSEVGDEQSYSLVVFNNGFNAAPDVTGLGDLTPVWVTWATDDRLLVAVVTAFDVSASVIRWPSARILALDPDGSDVALLFDNQRGMLRRNTDLARITSLLPDDPDHLLMPGRRNGDLDLWRVNIRTGDAERVAVGGSGTFAWFVDLQGRPAMRLDANRAGTVIKVLTPDPEGGRWREVARVREEDRLEFQPLAAAERPGEIYTAARPDGEDRAGIYVYDTVANRFLRQVAADPRVDVQGVLADARTGAFAGYFYVDDRLEYRFSDPETQRHFDAVREFVGGDVSMRIYDRSQDGRRWIVETAGPREPGAFYLYDLDATHIEGLFGVGESPESYAPMQVVRYQARDGLEITAYLSLPPDREPERLPLVVMPHGGPELRDMLTFDVFAQYLATRGYAVLQPNFRGSSGYGQSFADAGRREWGGAMQNDLVDGVRHLASEGIVDPERVCIFGASYGGYAALAGVALNGDVFRCAISLNGVSDLRGFLRHVRGDDMFDDDDYAYWVAHIGDPRQDEDALRARSPRRLADRIEAPVLLLHGTLDALVPVRQSRDMAEALEDAGVVHELVTFEGEGHSSWSQENEAKALDHVGAFLARHLPPD